MTTKTDNFKATQTPLWADGELANGANYAQFIAAIAALIDETKAEAVEDANSSKVSEERIKELAQIVLNTPGSYESQTLYTDLVSKINQAKSDAISAAGTDATQKADAVKTTLEPRLSTVETGLADKLNESDFGTKLTGALNDETIYTVLGIYTKLKGLIDDKNFVFDYNTQAKQQVGADIAEALKTSAPYSYRFDSGALTVLQNGNGSAVTISQENGAKFLKPTNGKDYAAEVLATDKSAFILTRPDGARLVYDVNAATIKPAGNLIG